MATHVRATPKVSAPSAAAQAAAAEPAAAAASVADRRDAHAASGIVARGPGRCCSSDSLTVRVEWCELGVARWLTACAYRSTVDRVTAPVTSGQCAPHSSS